MYLYVYKLTDWVYSGADDPKQKCKENCNKNYVQIAKWLYDISIQEDKKIDILHGDSFDKSSLNNICGQSQLIISTVGP